MNNGWELFLTCQDMAKSNDELVAAVLDYATASTALAAVDKVTMITLTQDTVGAVAWTYIKIPLDMGDIADVILINFDE